MLNTTNVTTIFPIVCGVDIANAKIMDWTKPILKALPRVLTLATMKINVRKPSNFRSGKGPMDGIGTASKISFFRKVFSREVKISNPKEFGEYVNHISGVHSLYLLTD